MRFLPLFGALIFVTVVVALFHAEIPAYLAIGFCSILLWRKKRDLMMFLTFVYFLSLNSFLGYSSGYGPVVGTAELNMQLLAVVPFVILIGKRRAPVAGTLLGRLVWILFLIMMVNMVRNLWSGQDVYGTLKENFIYAGLLAFYFIGAAWDEDETKLFVQFVLSIGIIASVMEVLGILQVHYPLRPPAFEQVELEVQRYYQQGSIFFLLTALLGMVALGAGKSGFTAIGRKTIFFSLIASATAIAVLGFRSIWVGVGSVLVALLLLVAVKRSPKALLRMLLGIVGFGVAIYGVLLVSDVDVEGLAGRLFGLSEALSSDTSSLAWRFITYEYMLRAIEQSPYLGVGILRSTASEIHSQSELGYYDVLYKFGIVGASVILLVCAVLFWRAMRAGRTTGDTRWKSDWALAYGVMALASGLGVNLISIPESLICFTTLLGLADQENRRMWLESKGTSS